MGGGVFLTRRANPENKRSSLLSSFWDLSRLPTTAFEVRMPQRQNVILITGILKNVPEGQRDI